MKVFIRRGKWVVDTRIGDKRVVKVLVAEDEAAAKVEAESLSASGALIKLAVRAYARYRDYDIVDLWRRTKGRAACRGIPFELQKDDVLEMFRRSNHACEVTGIAFDRTHKPAGSTKRPYCASIDRIDNTLGYTPTNCRLVCTMVNVALGEWGIEALMRVGRALRDREGYILADQAARDLIDRMGELQSSLQPARKKVGTHPAALAKHSDQFAI